MPSNPSVLALFAPQPPVEPTTPKPDYGSDSDFNDYLSNATKQVEKTTCLSISKKLKTRRVCRYQKHEEQKRQI